MNNDEQRNLINDIVCAALESKKQYTDVRLVLDRKTNEYAWSWKFAEPDFYVLHESARIFYNGNLYDMKEKTVSLLKKKLKQDAKRKQIRNTFDNIVDFSAKAGYGIAVAFAGGLAICVAAFTVTGIVYGLDELINRKQKQVEKEVKAYEKTLPNWNDTIRFATTDSDITRAINKREQQQLQIKHYRDSLMNEKVK